MHADTCIYTHTFADILSTLFLPPDFLEEEEVVEAEDEAEIVGTQSPKKPSYPSQISHTSNPSHHHSKPGPTPAGREGEEEDVDPDEEEEGAVNSIIHRRERRHFLHRDGQTVRDLDRDWGRDHTRGNMRKDSRKGLEKPKPRVLDPDTNTVVRGRTLSWIHTGPVEQGHGRKGGERGGGEGRGGQKGAETLPKLSKSSLLFPQKSSLSALASRAKQILSNSAHSNNPNDNGNKLAGNKKEENKIYITRPRPAKERERERVREQRRERKEERASRHPREVFPGVFLYQTGKTTRLVNLGAKGHTGGAVTGGRNFVSAPQLWPNPPTKEGKASHNESISIQSEHVKKSVRKAALPKELETGRRRGEHRDLKTTVTADQPSKEGQLTPLSHQQDPPPPPVTMPRLNSTENTLQGQSRVTSYLRISEITESQQQPDPDPNVAELDQDTNRSNPDPDPDPEPEPEEGEMSDYSYEEVEARPGWAEESINWQRTFSVNPMDFELLRSDWNDLRCNVSGNLQLAESEVVDVLAQYMEKLNERNGG